MVHHRRRCLVQTRIVYGTGPYPMAHRARVQTPILMVDYQLGSTARSQRNAVRELWLDENRQCEPGDLTQRVVVAVVLQSRRAFLVALLGAQ